jgi:hypothetical protein
MKLFLLFILVSIITGCSSKDFVGSPKFESALNIKLKKMIEQNDQTQIGVILLATGKLEKANQSKLKETGISIGSEVGNIITATGTPDAIIKAGELEFIKQIQLAKKNYLKK